MDLSKFTEAQKERIVKTEKSKCLDEFWEALGNLASRIRMEGHAEAQGKKSSGKCIKDLIREFGQKVDGQFDYLIQVMEDLNPSLDTSPKVSVTEDPSA